MNYKFANRLSFLQPNPLRENARKNMVHPEVISFAFGFPPEAAFPIDKMAKISKELYELDDHEIFLQYGDTKGHPMLLEPLANRLKTVYDVYDDETDDLMIVSGSTQGMDLTVKAFCNEGDIVLMEAQTFSGAVNAVLSYGAIAKPIEMKGETIDLEQVEMALANDSEGKIKLIYLIPTFQNPLGTSMPLEARYALYEIAKKYGVVIYEDDPYGDLLYEGEPIPRIKSFDTEGLVIYSGSFSKILAPSTRLGFITAPKPIIDKLILGKQSVDSHTNQYWQLVAAKLMTDYDFEAHIESLRDLYREKFNLMLEGLEKIDSSLLTYIRPTGGYFLCAKLGEGVCPVKFNDYLIEHHVAIIPGNVMSVEKTGFEQFFRLNFTKPTLEEIEKGMAIINEALRFAAESSKTTKAS
ncbi:MULTISPECIES: PLP-dependent aminotransferase family protein [unclassified Enterococcus]|uniref:aminotransferase-like domain-containing protein n=1 Tax=unclassified Enterococcus TaxID=2608891 RepID=UPI001556D9EB|nr:MULTISPECIES: PLP-dependent aminotransferase family protein [unclassified Enterococcus]MBS7576442.1 PLP-dependent aminotransferase family protein [Enterococcus sp. MMGLQ5-2]MBS7583674.1 PLP-dependent aminotransferase family protein [Enterococcus sp. MMGLQ5-1]NPD11535.1 PLP-dependent aminotransferase family protein [Enterococcus sp. MMGLQ5-1]NPD36279.1 PLP-dependent aminotransferase family protein [Enterococcus sp. MMGLQ5-2]